MPLIDRYLFKTLLQSALGTLAVLLVLDLVVDISGNSNKINHAQTLVELLLDFAKTLPSSIQLYLPAAVLLGSLLGLGHHANHQELTLLQASGCSQWRLVRSGIYLALLLAGGGLLVQEFAPKPKPESDKALWLFDGEQMVHIGKIEGNTLYDLYFYRAQPLSITHAKSALWNGSAWQLHAGQRQTLSHAERLPPESLSLWQSALSPEDLQLLSQQHQILSLRDQQRLIELLHRANLYTHHVKIQYLQQLTSPLTLLTMLLIALPFAFGHSRFGGQGARLLMGILLGLAYYLIQGMLNNLSALLGWSPWTAVLVPKILFLAYPLYHLHHH